MSLWTPVGGGALGLVMSVLARCGTETDTPRAGDADAGTASSQILAESASARARVGELRARFVLEHLEPRVDELSHGAPTPAAAKTRAVRVPALGAAKATGFERSGSHGLRAVLPLAARREGSLAAAVELPMHADWMMPRPT